MLTENTITKLQEMRLSTMANAFKEQLSEPNISELSFEDRFGLLVDKEYPLLFIPFGQPASHRRMWRLLCDVQYSVKIAVMFVTFIMPKILDISSIQR